MSEFATAALINLDTALIAQSEGSRLSNRALAIAIGALGAVGLLSSPVVTDANAATLALIDTGGDVHRQYVNPSLSYNALNGTSNVTDEFGHGNTMLQSIIDRLSTPALSTACKDKCDVMIVKDAGADGGIHENILGGAIRYAYTHGADVINLSLSFSDSSPPDTNAAIAEATRGGAVVVIASGNGTNGNYIGTTNPFANALAAENQQNAIIVGSINQKGLIDSGSNHGPWVDTGDDGRILVGIDNNKNIYEYGGTSTSAARVSVTALGIKQRSPNLSPQGVEDLITSNSTSTSGADVRCHCKVDTESIYEHGLGLKISNGSAAITYRNSGHGKVSIKDRSCRKDCTIKYNDSPPVKVVAKPDQGYKFKGWRGLPLCHRKAKPVCEFQPGEGQRKGVLKAMFTRLLPEA